MTEYGKANLEALEKYFGVKKEILEENKIETEITVGVEEIEDRTVLFARKGEATYQLDSLYDSVYYTDIWFKALCKLRFRSKVILFGLGNGMYVRKLLQETKKDITILVYEPSVSIICKAMEAFDFKDIFEDERVHLLIRGCTPLLFGEVIRDFIQYEDLSGLVESEYLNYSALFPEEAEYFKKEITIARTYEEAESTLWKRHGWVYYRNTLANLHKIDKSRDLADLWEKIPKSLPAIIVAAGPSLDKNIEQLKKAKGKCFMIAADSALRPLLKHGIIPDLFVSIDGNKMQAHFSDERVKNIPLVCNLQSHSELLRLHEAEKFFVRGIDTYTQQFMESIEIVVPVLKTGGSVANDCFEIARILGLTTIILVGQDLAYTNNQTHSADSVRGEWAVDVAGLHTLEVEGIDGNPILSSYEFLLYLHWFEERIQKYPLLKVIDATEGGAKIQGARLQSLEQTIREECTESFDVPKCIKQTDTLLTAKEQMKFKQYVQNIPLEVEKAVIRIENCIRDYEKLLILIHTNKYKTKECLQLFKKVSKVTKEIEEIAVLEFIQYYMQEETTKMLESVYEIEENERKEMIAACNLGKEYLQKMQVKAKELLPTMKTLFL